MRRPLRNLNHHRSQPSPRPHRLPGYPPVKSTRALLIAQALWSYNLSFHALGTILSSTFPLFLSLPPSRVGLSSTTTPVRGCYSTILKSTRSNNLSVGLSHRHGRRRHPQEGEEGLEQGVEEVQRVVQEQARHCIRIHIHSRKTVCIADTGVADNSC